MKAEDIILHPRLFRAASFIETAVSNIRVSLLLGGVLVSIVLFLFLLDMRTALISLSAIPLSLLAAIIVLDRFGATMNTLTIGGLRTSFAACARIACGLILCPSFKSY